MSAQGPYPSFFFFWGTFICLGGLLGQGLGLGLGPGLDRNNKIDEKELDRGRLGQAQSMVLDLILKRFRKIRYWGRLQNRI